MANKLYVGSLAYATRDESLRAFFEQAGTVLSASVIMERDMPNRSKGFGFVEMGTEEEAQKAIEMFDGKELDGRTIRVSIAQPKEDRPRRDFNQGGNGGNWGSR